MAVLFNWNLSRNPFLRQIFHLKLLLCTGIYLDMQICPYAFFSCRDQLIIERLIEAMKAALVYDKYLQDPSKFLFTGKILWSVTSHSPKFIKH